MERARLEEVITGLLTGLEEVITGLEEVVTGPPEMSEMFNENPVPLWRPCRISPPSA